MKAPILYRISSVLLLLFAAGHTFEFRQNNPEWGADAVHGVMRSVHFDAQGFHSFELEYTFTTPIIFSTVSTACLTAAAWLSAKTN